MKLLLISNSTNAGEEYLRYPLPEIEKFLHGVKEVVFVPYAAVTFSYAAYEKKVQARLAEIGIRVKSVHRAKDPAKMVSNGIRISSLLPSRMIPHTIPTALICLLAIPKIFLLRWIFRTNCRHCTHPVLYSMHSWAKNCLTGRVLHLWYAKLQKTTNCHIIRCLQPIPSVKITVIFPAKYMNAQSAARKQKYTAVSPGTIVRYRTGMMVRAKSLKTAKYTISAVPC